MMHLLLFFVYNLFFVYSGDNHIGNITRPYNDRAGQRVQQRGLINLHAVLDWITEQQRSGALAETLSELVIEGGSAGIN